MKMTAQKMLKKRREKAAKEKAASQGAAAGAAKKSEKAKVTGTGGMYVGSGDNRKLNVTKEQLDKSGMTLTGYANYMNRNDGKRPTGETKTSPQAKPKAGTRGQMGRADRRPKFTKEDTPKVRSNELPGARRARRRNAQKDAAKDTPKMTGNPGSRRAQRRNAQQNPNPRSAQPITTGTPTPSQGTMARSAARGNPAPTTPDTPDMLAGARRRQQRGMKGGGMAKKGYARGGTVRGAGIAKKGVRKCKMR